MLASVHGGLVLKGACVAVLGFVCATASASIVTTAGTVTGLEGDTAVDSETVFQFIDAASPDGVESDGVLHMLLDLGSVQNIDQIVYVNRLINVDPWPLNAAVLDIKVAADESLLAATPTSASDFTETVFSGAFTVASQAPQADQVADIVDTTRRYFLIDFSASYVGSINGVSNDDRDRVQLDDLRVVTVPEPASLVLVFSGAACLLVGRPRRTSVKS